MYLSAGDLRGRWRKLLPELAADLPEPHPVFDPSEEKILYWAFPVALTQSFHRLKSQLVELVDRELRFRLRLEGADRRAVTQGRETWFHSVEGLLENALLNDYGRGFVEILLLLLSAQIQGVLTKAPKTARRLSGAAMDGEKLQIQLATRFGALVIRASSAAADHLRAISDSPARREGSPLLGLLFRDPMLLVQTFPPVLSPGLATLMPGRFEGKLPEILDAGLRGAPMLEELLSQRQDLCGAFEQACEGDLRMGPSLLLQPCLLEMLGASGLLARLGVSASDALRLKALGLHLKASEMAAWLRRIILPLVAEESGDWAVIQNRRKVPVAASTRPLDFTKQGVVETTVFRFGLIYDLRDFSEIMEGVRKQGRPAEEAALQFMYIFQGKTEEIARRHRLRFEKFLGDGAFLSSRRAVRALAAAAEIQASYIDLKKRGFPFSKGMRVALNAGEYQLLPMRSSSSGRLEYEFFGHGIVELARLTTGKSTREIHEVAQMLIGRGYDPELVEDFLRPLMEIRGEHGTLPTRKFSAYLDAHGELINEGIVLTVPFVLELERELGSIQFSLGSLDHARWVVLKLDGKIRIALRFLGTARLKGLDSTELLEAMVWGEEPTQALETKGSLVDLLRRMGRPEGAEDKIRTADIPENLIVAYYRGTTGKRHWILGHFRKSDAMVLHALEIPIKIPQGEGEHPVELWLFENRAELAKMYEVIRRDTSGRAVPLSEIMELPDASASYLSSPHKTPG